MSSGNDKEPRNPFHPLLLITGLFFVVTTLAYAVLPMLEAQQGIVADPDDTSLRGSLRNHGWKWILIELILIVIFGLGLMLLDRARLRRLQNQPQEDTIPPQSNSQSSDEVNHEQSQNEDRETTQGNQST